ncbi:MAG: stage II sporulation protein D [Methylocystaceae bacterium]
MKINWKAFVLLLIIIGIIIGAGSRCSPSSDSNEPIVKLYLTKDSKIITLPLETYLIGVVGAEMPASFGNEALKAQAVTARTYTLKRLYGAAKHPRGAAMCDDITCCQAYIDPQAYKKQFGTSLYSRRFVPVSQAVKSTRGQVILYHQQLIDTPYFSTCGGYTASAAEVWGKEIPYLQSVPCRFCRNSKRFNNEFKFNLAFVNQRLKLPSRQKFKFKAQAMTTSGRLSTAKVDGKEVSGQELRRLFDLSSTQVIMARQTGNQVIFKCRGYGHGVGMCQYGAGGMGSEGYSYQQILQHYYQNVQVIKLTY